jgi:hypothetical protein
MANNWWEAFPTAGNQGRVVTPPPSAAQAATTGRTVVQTRGDMIDNQTKAATQAALIAKAQADAQAAENAAKGITPEIMQQRAARLAQLNAINKQLRKTWDAFAAGPGKTKGISGLADYNPFLAPNATFNTAGAGLIDMAQNAFRTPGQGGQSDKELAALVEASKPRAGDVDEAAMAKMGNVETKLYEAYKTLGVPFQPYRPNGFGQPASKTSVIRYDRNGNPIR